DMNVRVVDERIEPELRVDRIADVLGSAHPCVPFLSRCNGGCPASHESISRTERGKGGSGSPDIGPRYGRTRHASSSPAHSSPPSLGPAGISTWRSGCVTLPWIGSDRRTWP